jgi:hypothetical protein
MIDKGIDKNEKVEVQIMQKTFFKFFVAFN